MQKYEVRTGDLRSSILVGRSDGASAEFLLAETYDRLEKVRQRDSAAWDGPRLFEELEQCLRGKALGAFRDNVAREYPTDAEKTATNYDMLKKDILTTLTDRTYPGDSVHDYITSEISYLKCKDEKGNVDKPSHFLARMRQLRDFGARMHHNQGTTFLSERDFLAAVWRAFPDEMQEWLTIEHRIDPFDTNNPLDADEVCDHMHGYWFQRLQPKVSKTSSRGRGDVSGDVADVDDVDGEDDEENGNEDERKPPARADADRRARSRRRGDKDHQDVEADAVMGPAGPRRRRGAPAPSMATPSISTAGMVVSSTLAARGSIHPARSTSTRRSATAATRGTKTPTRRCWRGAKSTSSITSTPLRITVLRR